MRHVRLMCKNHKGLRWNCKSIAYTPGKGYNSQRRLFFDVGYAECECPSSELTLAPEDPWFGFNERTQQRAILRDCGELPYTETRLLVYGQHANLMLYDYSEDAGGWAITSAVSEVYAGAYMEVQAEWGRDWDRTELSAD